MSDDDLEEIPHRFGRRALATGRVAASALRLAGRRLRRAREGPADAAIGESLARELDRMKGLAMKVGQVLSYFDGVLPDDTHRALRGLQRGTRPVAFERIAACIEAGLGKPVDELFDSIDATAVAAASIGQVHRGVYHGSPVAIKVQYPDVLKTFEGDFSRIRPLARLASLATEVDGSALADELRDRVLEECDYEREAMHQAAFRQAFAGDPAVVIPAIVAERSARTVLTSAWHDGDDFYALAGSSDAARRNASALVLARFAYHSLFALGMLNADPHPGNYLFPDRDTVVFLDFGCVRRFDRGYLAAERRLARTVIDDRRDEFRDAVLATGMVPRPKRFDFSVHWDLLCHQYAPYRSPHFRFTRDYIRAGMALSGPSNPNNRHLALPPPWIWQTRMQWGLHAVLARLQAEGPFADVLRAALDAPFTPVLPAPGSATAGQTSRRGSWALPW